MAISRKDPKGRKLREGGNWRNDGRYSYRYADVRTGKRLTVYAQDLPELREKEKQIAKDMEDNIADSPSISTAIGCSVALIFVLFIFQHLTSLEHHII